MNRGATRQPIKSGPTALHSGITFKGTEPMDVQVHA